MRALTVEEYAVLTYPLTHTLESDAESDALHELTNNGLAHFVAIDFDGEPLYGPTPHGDRAVRVHRAWLQSMGVG